MYVCKCKKMAIPGRVITQLYRTSSRFSVIFRSTRTSASIHLPAFFISSAVRRGRSLYFPQIRNYLRPSQVKAMAMSPRDPSSYSRPEFAVMKHVSLKLNVDFDKKILNGEALLSFDILEEAPELVLDVSGLTIESVETENGKPLTYKLDGNIPNFGSRHSITMPDDLAGQKTALGKTEFIINPSTNCPGCELLKLSMTYNGEFFKPIIEQTRSKPELKKREKENAIKQSKVKEHTQKEVEECCPSTFTMETIQVACNEPACSCDNVKRPSDDTTDTGNSKWRTDVNSGTDFPKETINDKAEADDSEKPIDQLKLRIKYSTAPTASALQWLDPQQTSGKKHPYMFSQCQPIHARSILPCQDTPAVKFTYDAEVIAPEEFTVLMSAIRGDVKGNKTTFRQPTPIPSYLLAIAVGALEYKELGPRTKVWTEKDNLERSAWEFAETEKYLKAAENLCGPYEWTQYDLLVLPPSFPYGGMENPCLTFVTPTLLAGDRSQADVIVHEIMHSWTGNLVTNKNFEHFWLNEGFTVFLERKVGASLIADKEEARKSRDFHSLLGLQELKEAVNSQFRPTDPLTCLSPDLTNVHPDDAFSRVPYEKGSLFLRYLEDLVGGPEVFDNFLRAYLKRFKNKSLDTDEFKAFLLNYFEGDKKLATVEWDKWLYQPGMPPVIPDYDTSMTKDIGCLITKIESNAPLNSSDVEAFSPHQIIHLLQELIDRPPFALDRLATLGQQYKVDGSNNSEIKYRWLRLCVRSHDENKLQNVFDFVNNQGRMKYVRPLYRELYAWEEVRQKAIDNFLKNEKNMMHVTAYTVRKDLHLDTLNE